LNNGTEAFKRTIARNTVTVLRNDEGLFPFVPNRRIAYVSIGAGAENTFGQRLVQDLEQIPLHLHIKTTLRKRRP
jgi:hypothetical protein